MSVQLDFRFSIDSADRSGDSGLPLRNPLFALLDAIRTTPSIGAAAAQLGLSYRHVWGELKRHEASFGQALIMGGQGRAARLSPFGERLLWAEKRVLARLLPKAESIANELDRELQLAIDPDLVPLRTCASHDLLFELLRDRLRRSARVLLDVDFLGSARALQRLNAGACTLAGIHLPANDERLGRRGGRLHTALGRELRLGAHKLIRFAQREQGLIVAAGNPLGIGGLPDLIQPGVRFINRPEGAGTRLILDELLAHAGLPGRRIHGYTSSEHTHLSVAATVAAGSADCGFGLRAAAARFGLDFVPLLAEDYFLVCLKPALDAPELQALLTLLHDAPFREHAASLAGYSLASAGDIVSLRRTLPWYK